MATFLPLVALALFVLAALSSESQDQEADDPSVQSIGFGAFTAAALLLAAFLCKGLASDAWYAACGFAIATLAASLVALLPRAGRAGAVALAAAVCALAAWLPSEFRVYGLLGATVGASLSLWFLPTKGFALFGLVVAGIAATDVLGSRGFQEVSFASAGTAFGVAAASALVLRSLFGKQRPAATGLAIGVAALLAAGFVVGQRFLDVRDAWVLFSAGLAVALATHWYMPDDDANEVFRAIVCAVLWILLATVAFGLRKGFGMSLAMLGGLSGYALLGSVRPILTLGPLLGLVLYRVFREMHVDATRALDIGQHYALVGLMLGAVVTLLPFDWHRPKSKWLLGSSGLLWTALLLLATVGVGIVMGPKGMIGWVAGLGLCGLLAALRKHDLTLQPLALSCGLGAAAILVFAWLGANAQLSREDKLRHFLPLAAALAVLGALLMLIGRKPRSAEANP